MVYNYINTLLLFSMLHLLQFQTIGSCGTVILLGHGLNAKDVYPSNSHLLCRIPRHLPDLYGGSRYLPCLCGVPRYHPDLCGVPRCHPDLCGVSRYHPDLYGVPRYHPDLCGVPRHLPDLCGVPRYQGWEGSRKQTGSIMMKLLRTAGLIRQPDDQQTADNRQTRRQTCTQTCRQNRQADI